MRAPTNYAGPRKEDNKHERTWTQSTQTNLAQDTSTVAQVLEKKGSGVYTISEDDTVAQAIDVLKEKRIGAVVVLSAASKLVGILSERDVVRRLADQPEDLLSRKVSLLMSSDVKVCAPQDSLISVLSTMTNGRFRHLPVMHNGALAGIVTIGDVVNYRLRELEHQTVQLKQMIVG
ncbi:MAG: CBS domain-containing protein [Sphingomonadales bacterium]